MNLRGWNDQVSTNLILASPSSIRLQRTSSIAAANAFGPSFSLLSARLCGYTGREHHQLGSLVEFIHTATLLHDDVVDDAEIRRGHQTARKVWGNQVSILVGDYLYSKAMCQVVEFREPADQ